MAEKRGIDISRYQGKPDFAKLKNAVDFVILQIGFGRYASQVDAEFERNYAECKKHGIPVGGYWFSYATSPQDAIYEAGACLELIKGKQFEYPIYFDIEGSACSGNVAAKCENFCEELEKKGYFAGIYISRSPAQQFLSAGIGKKYALWLAEYGGRLNWLEAVGMWQNSSTGRFPGISGDVDTDICYEDYPKLIKAGGYNNFEPEPAGILDTEGFKRGERSLGVYALKRRLKALGYNVDDTQGFGGGTEKAVNKLLGLWGYEPNGIAGEKFLDIVMK
jgi:GH25 family lysozyme M1 (1,4-beta-N-acetylmuramidase)